MGLNQFSDRDDVLVKGSASQSDDVGKQITYTDVGTKTRMDVDAPLGMGVTESSQAINGTVFLLNGTSFNGNVNGNNTPVQFVAGPPSGEIWYIHAISFYLSDSGSTAPNEFGSLNELSNGVLFEADIGGVQYGMTNLINNLGVGLAFSHSLQTSSDFSAGSILGTWDFADAPIKLDGDNSDQIIMNVRDNLVGIDYMSSRISYYQVIG